MDGRLIFYSARKTSACERSLKKSFSELDISVSGVTFAVDNMEVGMQITAGFEICNVIFVIGGLSIDGKKGIKSIISRALGKANVDECKKLHSSVGEDGYVIRAGRQLLILLPDEPARIEEIMQGPVSRYIQITEEVRV